MNRSLPLAAVVALAVAAGGWMMTRPGAEALVTPAFAEGAATDADVALAPDWALGAADAPITLIEYASFTCPHCAHFHEDVFKPLKRDYIDTGKVRFILREVYFDQFGLLAGQIAHCAGEIRYYGISGMFFEQQAEWIASNNSDEITAGLRKVGKVAGLTDEQMDTCIADEATTASLIAAFQTHFTEDKIEGTPSLTINGELFTNMSYKSLQAILDEKLAAQ